MCKKFYLTSLTLLLSLVSNIHALEITTIDGIGADTYLSNDGQGGNYGPDSVHGADNSIAIRNYEGVRQKFGYIRFDLTGIAGDLSGATLSITINISNRNRNWLIYGLIDESLDNWDEATTSYSNAPGILPAALGSFALDENKLQLLGILSVLENTPTRETPNIYTSNTTDLNLDSFLQSDTNKIVTFVIINENSDSNASYWVATKEGNPAAAPKLTLPNAAFSGAMNPKPANGTEDIVRDGIILSWTPGESAISHDVYFGEDPNLVSNADRTNPSGVLLIEGHESNSIALDRQNFAKTYYWRIDEVSGTPEPIYKGQLWSFTTESLAYSIPGELITATTDSNEPGQGPENTINGSGLDNGLHSNESATMWLTTTGQTAPVSIKYEFDKIYKLYEMLVWNYNGESILSMYGFRDVSVEYSIDDVNWIQIEGVSEFSQAPGTDGYASDITIEFGDVTAKYVRITAGSNWSNGLFDQYGLSEVRFMYIPTSARGPDQPANGATDVALDTIISWKSGREVVEHDIYLSKDRQSVIDGTAFVTTVSQSSYGPLSLELGSTYYWRIDEVNNTAVIPLWPGDIWSFTTQEYLVVDDFESYNEIAEGQEGSNLVYLTWIDGYANPSTNGSTTGYFEAFQPTMETNIVHSGNQSVPIFYNNITAGISEVTVSTNSLPIGPDWASVSPEFLSIWFYGDPNNAETDQMYVEIDGSRTTYDGDLIQDDWQQWSIDLTSPGINLANVGTLTIGFESTGATGTSGKVIFDDIQLYTPAYIEQ
jgi:hypothetical protein